MAHNPNIGEYSIGANLALLEYIFGQLGPLFQRQKRRFVRMTEKNTDHDNDGSMHGDYGNFDDNDDKNHWNQENKQIL